ncbi:hypothetical protein B0E47_16585 [Rhodanobacter sp. B05]|uniref:3-oxoacyl-ACP synthase III family protein n=1 Tax=Rhodanobacter sp. B05 TaxID=1945859 RepID=UPI0009861234|nr:ketoacyl-ACP synthase III [Rhodanobacter sp. B05]OOG52865.1 hypothetical protein B0E47_16585 [Rhodanobacter sp. B05]
MKALSGVAVRAIAAAVPTDVARTQDYEYLNPEERLRFQKATGIASRHIVRDGQCASDLCIAAAEQTFEYLDWSRESVGALVLITQTGDQPVPATAIVIQQKLGLPQNCVAFDVNLGCSSYPYGLAIVGSMMQSLGINRALLLIGDVSSRVCAKHDKSSWPLFGDAGSATALELDEHATPIHLDLMSDGSGKDAIIIPGGGLASKRPPPLQGTVQMEASADGILRRPDNLILRGADIFSFAISKVPLSIRRVVDAGGTTPDDIDLLVLHQANKMINDTIAKKLGFTPDKVPTSIEHYGNTSSASIPVTLCTNASLFREARTIAVSGFGVGLSWGSAVLQVPANSILTCVESDAIY